MNNWRIELDTWRPSSSRKGIPSFLARERHMLIGIKYVAAHWTESSTSTSTSDWRVTGWAVERAVVMGAASAVTAAAADGEVVSEIVRATAAGVVVHGGVGGARRRRTSGVPVGGGV